MSMILDGSNGVTFNDSSLQGAAASPYVLKNRIINGDMRIDQRNAGASVTATAGAYFVDRFFGYKTSGATITAQQSSTAPTGFSNSLLLTCSTGSAPSAGNQVVLSQRIEGFNTSDLNFGTSSAATITLSFWVRSSITGTYCAYFVNAGYNRSYVATYTINAANTWEQKSITITGDTSGTWTGATNGIGLSVGWSLGSGSNFNTTSGSWQAGEYQQTSSQAAWSTTTGATFYITGVQLEVGSTATPFERRMYTNELQLCQRYYWVAQSGAYSPLAAGSAFNNQTTTLLVLINFPTSMRAGPTLVSTSGTNIYAFTRNGTVDYFNSFSQDMSSTDFTDIYNNTEISGTAGQPGMIYGVDASCKVAFNAEL